MASNTLTNMRMTNPIKGLVSKRKKRYKQDGFNLDLSYICDNIIAMGYPAKNLEGVYRNHIDDVIKFLNTKHNAKYKIYNLCEEKKYQYDINKFQQSASYPFSDHNPPNIELIQGFCTDVHDWLLADPENVAAIHCKAGKGRTGTMICCYLLHCGQYATAADALNYYGKMRTTDKKGVTIPSQRRYVEYYSQLLKSRKPYAKVNLQISEIKLHQMPPFKSFGGSITFSISNSLGQKLYTEQLTDLKRVDNYALIKLDRCIALTGDIKVEFSCTQIMKHKQKLFHYWFNTYFINDLQHFDADGNVIFELEKPEIDDAHKDKHKMFPENFRIETILQKFPPGSYLHSADQNVHHNNNHVTNNNFSGYHHPRLSNGIEPLNNNNNNNNNHLAPSSHIASHQPPQMATPLQQTPSESSCTESSTESSSNEEDWESELRPHEDDQKTTPAIDSGLIITDMLSLLQKSAGEQAILSERDGKDTNEINSELSRQHNSNNNFARNFLFNTRRRMSSGLTFSYGLFKPQRRDST